MKYIVGSKSSLIVMVFTLSFLALTTVASAQTVSVGNVEELYAAVSNPANVGATLVLAPGIYTLSVNGPNGTPHPDKGRIDLLENMSLLGVVGDRSAVTIDAINLPASSFTGTPGPNAAVRLGRGTNSLQWLTVRNAKNGQANIDSGLQMPGIAYVTVAHVESYGSTRGINIQNFGPGALGETIEADIIDNDLHDNVLGAGEGVRFGNFQGAIGSTVNARMIDNRSWGNLQGRTLENVRTNNSTINVFSSGNRFFVNGAGTIVIGGLSSNATTANGNTVNLEASGDDFFENTVPAPFDVGGLVLLGGENTDIPFGTNYNTVNVKLWNCHFNWNGMWDVTVIGARSNPESIGHPGIYNRVTYEISSTDGSYHPWSPIEYFAEDIPFDPADGNIIRVIRH